MSRLVNALILVAVIALAPLVPLASAHPSIGLTTDVNHVILNPGEATNITLTIHNNGSSIETYSINVSGYDSVWEIIPSESTVSNVIPTYSDSTTIAVRLSTSALPSNSGTLTITVTEPDANVSSQIEVLLSVQPRHLPSISAQTAGDNGLVEMDPGTEVNLSISVRNDGNVNDTILLSVGQTPDLAGFWANWTSGGNNNSENTSETNNTDMGNSTGGGNNTSGNNTGSGNSTNDGNNSSTNNTGGNSTEGGTNNTGGDNAGGNSTNNSSGSSPGTQTKSGHNREIRFLDDSMDSMVPGESRIATLRVSIPSDERPGYYGFELFAASALGNYSVSTTLVVEVTALHALTFSHQPGAMLLPGQNSTSTITVESLSNDDGNWTWESDVVSGDCHAELMSSQSVILEGEISELYSKITAGVNTHVNDECDIHITGTLDSDNTISELFSFTVTVGEVWGLSMVIPTTIKLDVDELETFNIAITNDGTEEDTVSLIGIDEPGIVFSNPDPVTLSRGESVYVQMGVQVDSTITGDIMLQFSMSSTNSGQNSILDSGMFEVKEFADVSIEGPSDGRLIITPGDNSSAIISLSNQGTKTLEFDVAISGLPSGISVISGLDSLTLSAGESNDIVLILNAEQGIQPTDQMFTVEFNSDWISTQISLELQVTDRVAVSLDSSKDRIVASPTAQNDMSVQITNLGTSQETFVINLDTEESSDYFDISISTLSTTLEPGASESVTLYVTEIAAGAPASGLHVHLTVTSTTDSTINEELEITIVSQIADGQIVVISDDNEAEPGQTISGTVVITNLGTSTDVMRINSVELDCGLSEIELTLGPNVASDPIPWSCQIGTNENAGVNVLTFRLTSSARSSMVITNSESYTILPVWGNDVVDFTVDNYNLIFDESNEQQTISVTVCNTANVFIEGKLELLGKNEPQMDGAFFRAGETGVNESYSLSSGGCQDFKLMLTPLNLDGFNSILTIRSVSQVQGATVIDNSNEISARVNGPELPPNGLDLGMVELNNKNSGILLATGWGLALVLMLYIRLFRKTEIIEEEPEEEEIPLGPNEVRVDEYNKVTCTNCEARLGVPEGSEPPFRFTCPKCETRIRVVE